MKPATAPTAEITDFIPNSPQLELVFAGGTWIVNAEKRRRGEVGDALNPNSVIVSAVIQPHAEAGDIVFGPDITIGKGVRGWFYIAD